MYYVNDYATGSEIARVPFYMLAVVEARDYRNANKSATAVRDTNGKLVFVAYSDGTETYCPDEDELSPFENDYFNDDENY